MFNNRLNKMSGKQISQIRYSLYKQKAVVEARMKTLEERIYNLEERIPFDLYGIDDEVFDENLADFEDDYDDSKDDPEGA